MKLYLIAFFLLYCGYNSLAQTNFAATYKVTKPLVLKADAGKETNMELEYEGRVFVAGSKTLLYQRPLFLEKYPDGEISISYPGGISMYKFSKDSVQLPELYDTDSMRKWMAFNNAKPSLTEFMTHKFKTRVSEWKLLSEMKIINGLNCQRAKLYYPNKTAEVDLFWDVWFCVDIPFVRFFGLEVAPGLIVEAENKQAFTSYSLLSLDSKTILTDDVFKPSIFSNVTFKDLDVERRKPSKTTIKQDIMDQ